MLISVLCVLLAPDVTRADLATAYMRFDRALQERPLVGSLNEINREFDSASLAFFAGNPVEAIERISRLTERLQPGSLYISSLKFRLEPGVILKGSPPVTTLRFTSMFQAQPGPNGMKIRVRNHADKTVLDTPFKVDTAGITLRIPDELATPGAYAVEVVRPGSKVTQVARLVIAARSFDDVRVSNLERIRKIKLAKADLAPALGSVIARNALLTDTPTEANTAQLLADPTVLAAEVEREIQAISNGHDPYTDRLGDTWRSIMLQARPLPFRVYAPKAASKRVPLPLVIAFHGAGGDENVFFNGYGAGIIKEVADDEGMIVVTPLTSEIARNPAAFASLLGVVSRNYVIDPARIYLLGHSLGAGVVMELGRQSKGKVAALCCISGGGGSVPDKTLPPLLILSGGLDPLVSSATLAAGVIKLRAGGQNVEIRTFADFGHTLIVGSKLREAVEWLLDHHL